MFTPLWPAGIELCCLMGVIPVFWEWVLWDGFITRVQFLWLFRNDIVASLCPYMGRSLWPISAGFLCAVWSQYLFYCCCSFSTSLPRPQPCVSLSEWVRSTAPLIPGPLNKKCKKIQAFQRGLFMNLRIVFGLFWDFGHWEKMTLFSERLATFSFYTLNSS